MATIDDVRANIAKGKMKLVEASIQTALSEGVAATDILNVMIEAMGEIGEKFSAGEIFVPEMLIAGKAMQKGVNALKPALAGGNTTSLGKCILGTVTGDLHDIGKNLVSLMIESAGFEIIDLGVDAPSDKFIEAIKANPDVKIVGLSGLLTTAMPAMKETVAAIKNSGLKGFSVIVGGAPVTQEFATTIGADGYESDAGSAAVKCKELAQAN